MKKVAAALRRASCAIAVLLVFAVALPASSFRFSSSGALVHWRPNTTIHFTINPGGVPGFTGELERLLVEGAVRDAFRAWTQTPNAGINFIYHGITSQTTTVNDGISYVGFQDTTHAFSPGELAVTVTLFNTLNGEIVDADILFNPQPPGGVPFSPVGGDNTSDIVAVAMHEIGHLIGLGHSGVYSSIMDPFAESGNGVSSRAIQMDDALAAAALWPLPSFAASGGTLTGRITNSSGGNVKAAHVAAVDAQTGAAVASALSGNDGVYQITGLPPGSYRVFVEPLDGPIGLSNFSSFYANGATNFGSTALGGLGAPASVALAAGQTATADISVPDAAASQLNITFSGTGTPIGGGTAFTLTSGSLYLPRGRTHDVVITATNISSGAHPSFSGAGISTGAASLIQFNSGTLASRVPVTVSPQAPLGPSNTVLADLNSTSLLIGGAVVTNNPQIATPLREGAGFAATLTPGGFVSIFGTDLAAREESAVATPLPTSLGGVSVKIGNRFAPLFFAGPGQINAQIPFETGGTSTTVTVVTGPNAAGNTVTVALSPTAPGIFSTNQQGSGQGAILNGSDNSFAAPVGGIPGSNSHPAHRNDVVVIFASGLGRVTPALPSGVAAGASGTAIPQLNSTPQVRIGGQLAAVEFAGLAPGFVGLYQVNARVPPAAPFGDAVPVQITTAEGQSSNTVTIAVAP